MSDQRIQSEPIHHQDTGGVKPPPRWLLWAIIGLFVLGILGVATGIFVFQRVLEPRYQDRVMQFLPFMQAFMPATPQGGSLPTPIQQDGDLSPQDLLAAPLTLNNTSTPTPEPASATPTMEASPTAALSSEASNTPEPTDQATATLAPTDPPPTQVPASQNNNNSQIGVQLVSLPASARMFGISGLKQTWNNCGPANITQALSFYGWTRDQSYAEQFLKPNREDKNVNPAEMVAFVNEQSDLRAITRMGGDLDLLKGFIAAQIPVIIETGYMPEGYDWIGHYQTVVAYDDLQDLFFVYDTYLGNGSSGEGLTESYASVDQNWKHFNRTFIAIYEPSRENEVREILGVRADPNMAAEHALEVAAAELQRNPRDVFARFNMGTAYAKLGRYTEAANAYDLARRDGTLPWRMIWYQFGPFEAYFNAGRLDEVMALVNINLTNGAQYVEETYYWQGRVLQEQGDLAGARSAFGLALQHNYRYGEARNALDAITA